MLFESVVSLVLFFQIPLYLISSAEFSANYDDTQRNKQWIALKNYLPRNLGRGDSQRISRRRRRRRSFKHVLVDCALMSKREGDTHESNVDEKKCKDLWVEAFMDP